MAIVTLRAVEYVAKPSSGLAVVLSSRLNSPRIALDALAAPGRSVAVVPDVDDPVEVEGNQGILRGGT